MGVKIDTETDWTLPSPHLASPKRTNERYPLSDQPNKGQWEKWEPLWDEFNGAKLDDSKWWDHNPRWYGRAPSRYLSQNVTQKNGEMGITMTFDPTLPEGAFYGTPSYRDYGAASVAAKSAVRYGYFEVRAKAMNSAGSSAFWLSGSAVDSKGASYTTEIDVFELGGKAPGYERKYNMNAHVFKHPQSGDKHFNVGAVWQAPFRFADDYHVYGLEWTPDFIRYYVDGALVRSMKNTHWHSPMTLLFDSETMGDWLGVPEAKDLPSTFYTDYIRVWKNAATDSDWTREFTLPNDPAKPTDITKYVHSMRK